MVGILKNSNFFFVIYLGLYVMRGIDRSCVLYMMHECHSHLNLS